MARFMSRAMAVRPVTSIKHVIDTNGALSAGGQSITDVIASVDNPLKTTSNQCATTSVVKSIYLRVEVIGKDSAGGVDNVYMYVFKNPANDLGNPAVDAIGVSDKRKFVIHQEMMMLDFKGTTSGFPRTLFKGVIKIPRHYQRNGVDDRLQVVLGHRPGEGTQLTEFCLQCIYKEFR